MESTAKDFLKYLDGNTPRAEMNGLQETIDDMLTRLEEYESVIDIVRSDRKDMEDKLNEILNLKTGLSELAYRIDAMEMFISRVHQDMDTLETKLVEAELDFPEKSENTFKHLFKPLLSKISPELTAPSDSSGSVGTAATFRPLKIYSTDEFFSKDTNGEGE